MRVQAVLLGGLFLIVPQGHLRSLAAHEHVTIGHNFLRSQGWCNLLVMILLFLFFAEPTDHFPGRYVLSILGTDFYQKKA